MEQRDARRSNFVHPYFNRPRTNNRYNALLSISLGIALLAVQVFFYQQTASLLLFCAALIQLSLVLFLLSGFLRKAGASTDEIRLGTAFLNGLIVLLLCGFIFLESYSRLKSGPPAIYSSAWLAAFFNLSGNVLLFFLLYPTRFLRLRFGSFHPPFPAMIIASIFIFVALAITRYTDIYLIDSLLSIPLGIFMFIWAVFVTLDAYWQILEFS